jgi:hypothetical protein
MIFGITFNSKPINKAIAPMMMKIAMSIANGTRKTWFML